MFYVLSSFNNLAQQGTHHLRSDDKDKLEGRKKKQRKGTELDFKLKQGIKNKGIKNV